MKTREEREQNIKKALDKAYAELLLLGLSKEEAEKELNNMIEDVVKK